MPEHLDKFHIEMRHLDIAVAIGVVHVVDIDVEDDLQSFPDEPFETFLDDRVRVDAAVHLIIFNWCFWFRRLNWFWRLRGGGQLGQKSVWHSSHDPSGWLGILGTKA